LDFGSVDINEAVRKVLSVENIGTGEITISDININGTNNEDFYILNTISFPLTIPAKSSVNLLVEFKPVSAGNNRNAILNITNNSDNANPVKTISLSGKTNEQLTKLLDVTPEIILDFGFVNPNSFLDQTILLENFGNTIISVTNIELVGADENQFQIIKPTNHNFDISSGETKEIIVRFIPTSTGEKSTTLKIHNNSDNEYPVKEILLKGGSSSGSRKIHVEPSEGLLYMGTAIINQNYPIYNTFTIKNIGDLELTIYDIILQSYNVHDFSITEPTDLSFQILPGDSVEVTVEFAPLYSSTGTRQVVISILNNSDNYPDYRIAAVGTDVEELSNNSFILVYPNPTKDILNIKFSSFPDEYNIELYNNHGQLVTQMQSTKRLEKLDLRNYPSGLYHLKVYNYEFSKMEKIILQNGWE